MPKNQGGKDTIKNLITLCQQKVHQGKITLNAEGVSGFNDQIAQRTMQGKTYLYQALSQIAPLFKVLGYQTDRSRKSLSLPKEHDVDALCIATLNNQTNQLIDYHRENFYTIKFRAKQTRRRYHDLPRKGKGRVLYQVNIQSGGFRKGDIVRVKNKWISLLNSIYSNARLAFARIKSEPGSAKPEDCQLLLRCRTVIWNYSL